MTPPDVPSPEPPDPPRPIDRELGIIVLQVSAAQVGICLTGIGLIRLIGQNGIIGKAADDVLALNALGFLITGVVAYLAMRASTPERQHRLERLADLLFLLCLTLMVIVGLLLAYEIL